VKIQISFEKLLLYVIAISSIALSGTMLRAYNMNSTLEYAFEYIMIFCSIILTIKNKSINSWRHICIFVPLSGIFILINYLLYPYSSNSLVHRIVWFILFLGVIEHCIAKNISISEIFYNVIVVIVAMSSLFYIVICIFRVNLPYTIFYNNSPLYYNYYNIFYLRISLIHLSLGSVNFYEYCSFFWEHGIYAIYINFALLYYVTQEKNNRKVFILLVINLLLTFSTTQYIVFAIICLLYYYRNELLDKKSKIIMLFPIILILGLAAGSVTYNKVINTNVIRGSYYERIRDIYDGLRVFVNHPIFGTGFMNSQMFMSIQNLGRGNTNSIITIMYTMGIIGVLFFFYPFVCSIVKGKAHKSEQIAYSIFILLSLASEPLYTTPFILILIAMEYIKSSRMNSNVFL
jgi:hypothetical protein